MVLISGDSTEEEVDISENLLLNRRQFISAATATTLLASTTASYAGSLLEPSDVKSLISRGLDNPEVMKEFRAMIKAELKEAYKNYPQDGYPSYNTSRIDNSSVFFGNVRGDTTNRIKYNRAKGTTYDDRIKGGLNFDTPSELLSRIDGRVREREKSGNIAFIMKDQYGADIFIYYENRKLKYMFPTTAGSDSTPDNMIIRGSYHREKKVTYNDRQLANRYNIKGQKGLMPYSRRLSTIDPDGSIHYEGINTHIGNVAEKKANGEENLSHGCARQGAFGAALIYHTVAKDTLVYHRPELYLKSET